MLTSGGLRISLVGASVFFVGLVSLLILPAGPAIAAMTIGACTVFGGFVWTLLSYYGAPPPGPDSHDGESPSGSS